MRSSSSSSSRSSSSTSSPRRRSSCRSRAPSWSSGSAAIAATLDAGFHILVPFVDVDPLPALPQGAGRSTSRSRSASRTTTCRWRVDGVLYLKVHEPRARLVRRSRTTSSRSPSSRRRRCAARSARSTSTARSRSARNINAQVVTELDKAIGAVGRQGAALRDQEHHAARRRPRRDGEADARRAREARGDPARPRASATPPSTPPRARSSRSSRPRRRRKQQQINEAEGQAAAILAVAEATAEGIRTVAEAIERRGGFEAVQLRVAEQYITQFGQLAKDEQHAWSCRRTSPTWAR